MTVAPEQPELVRSVVIETLSGDQYEATSATTVIGQWPGQAQPCPVSLGVIRSILAYQTGWIEVDADLVAKKVMQAEWDATPPTGYRGVVRIYGRGVSHVMVVMGNPQEGSVG